MTKRRRNILIGIIIVAAVSIAAVYFWPEGDHTEGMTPHTGQVYVEAIAIRTQAGWGYNIISGNKIYIHQEFIPAIQGYKPFASKEEALRAAGLVIQKISNGKLPSLTKREIDSLKITY